MNRRELVVLATAAAVTLGAATAVGQGADGPPTGMLAFETDARSVGGDNLALPASEKRPKAADLRAGYATIYVGGERAGRWLHFEVTAFEGARRYRGNAVDLTEDLYDFGGGNLLFMSCRVVDRKTDNLCAVTGGTGRYVGARGSAVQEWTKRKRGRMPVRVTFIP